MEGVDNYKDVHDVHANKEKLLTITPEEAWKLADTNKNGKVSRDEFKKVSPDGWQQGSM